MHSAFPFSLPSAKLATDLLQDHPIAPIEVFFFTYETHDSWESTPEGSDSPWDRQWGESTTCELLPYYTLDKEHAYSYTGRNYSWNRVHSIVFFPTEPIDPQNLPPLHLLWLTHSSGDSFGHATGKPVFIQMDTQTAPLLALQEQIPFENNCSVMEDQYSLCRLNAHNIQMSDAPWSGYFEHIEKIEVLTLQPLEPEPTPPAPIKRKR